ncbi:dynamin family protein, partial [Chromatium okenii]|uniref:dynamin family protein n=1 Tax=Chromatium okenii TaxID=61644 RepID=UPI0034E95DB2|nr:dynamin family protein [Chromatium okenii]
MRNTVGGSSEVISGFATLQHIDIIDSPGSGSTTLRDTIIAQRLIKDSDALLFLSEASTAFQKDNEMRLLHHVRQNVQEDNLNKLFVVATKVDRSERKPEDIACQEPYDYIPQRSYPLF